MKELELLAPAGSLTTLKAVVNAGADAVYLGGEMFGARAYADNFTQEELFEGIDYGHRNNCRVILAVNTLLKEEELKKHLYEYILPYYERGIDAVIVQDFGVMGFLHEQFPDLPLHTSTQMTVTGVDGAKFLVKHGASRIVMARELSFAEIRKIHDAVDVELEGFVHGALCYCYSGQCLLSSMLGGRSGNRGRCAQPCRLPYEVLDVQGKAIGKAENYILSPKDLCTIDNIPKLAECGLYSFKIEGRMKQAEYAAGVVSIYRKYMDDYLKGGKDNFHVSREDQKKLLELGNRSGFTSGYYDMHNGREMMTLDRPGHTKGDEALQEQVRSAYIDHEKKEQVSGKLWLEKGNKAKLEVFGKERKAEGFGDVVQQADKRPLTEEMVREKLLKTGNTPYYFDKLEIIMDKDVFLPVQALNKLRREVLDRLAAAENEPYRRKTVEELSYAAFVIPKQRLNEKNEPFLAVSVETREAFDTVLSAWFVKRVYLDSMMFSQSGFEVELKEAVNLVHKAGKEAYFTFPAVFRGETRERYLKIWDKIEISGLDGFLIKSYDVLGFCKERKIQEERMILDHNMYTYSNAAKEAFWRSGILYDTAPLELNKRELSGRKNANSELILYGYLPLMISAQCVHKNMEGCDKKSQLRYLKDRYRKKFAVKNNCGECYNIIYNSSPLSLMHRKKEIAPLGFMSYRLQFTNEKRETIREILSLYEKLWQKEMDIKAVSYLKDYTNGHFNRGVE